VSSEIPIDMHSIKVKHQCGLLGGDAFMFLSHACRKEK
jgi:hypothetical protein